MVLVIIGIIWFWKSWKVEIGVSLLPEGPFDNLSCPYLHVIRRESLAPEILIDEMHILPERSLLEA